MSDFSLHVNHLTKSWAVASLRLALALWKSLLDAGQSMFPEHLPCSGLGRHRKARADKCGCACEHFAGEMNGRASGFPMVGHTIVEVTVASFRA